MGFLAVTLVWSLLQSGYVGSMQFGFPKNTGTSLDKIVQKDVVAPTSSISAFSTITQRVQVPDS